MYTIGQFSRIGMISSKTLRFYDEIGLLKPAEVDKFTQYRYYSAEQVADVLLISELKEYGFSLEDISRLISSKDPKELSAAMSARLDELARLLEKTKRSMELMERRIRSLSEAGGMISSMDYRVELKEKPAVPAAGLRRRTSVDGINELLGELFRKISMLGLQPAGPVMAQYPEGEFNPESFEVEEWIPVNRKMGCSELDFREIGGGLHACTLHVGPYNLLGRGYAALLDWLPENGFRPRGGYLEIYLVGPENTRDEEKYVTEICIPVERE